MIKKFFKWIFAFLVCGTLFFVRKNFGVALALCDASFVTAVLFLTIGFFSVTKKLKPFAPILFAIKTLFFRAQKNYDKREKSYFDFVNDKNFDRNVNKFDFSNYFFITAIFAVIAIITLFFA